MEAWVGPAIVAALVSGLVSALGWFVSSWQAVRLEQRRREEKVHDFQVALRAEIASDRLALVVVDHEAFLEDIKARYGADPTYSVVVPHSASNTIFTSIVKEIHVLPGEIIGPVVRTVAGNDRALCGRHAQRSLSLTQRRTATRDVCGLS